MISSLLVSMNSLKVPFQAALVSRKFKWTRISKSSNLLGMVLALNKWLSRNESSINPDLPVKCEHSECLFFPFEESSEGA